MRDCNISLASGVVLDYEVKQSYRVTVEVTDGRDQNGDDDNDAIDETINVIVTVTDVNEAPVVTGDVSPSVMENTSAAVATYTGTDPERDTLIWSVNDDDFFWISDRGELYFRTPPSFEEGTSYQVTVTATDGEETASLSGSLPVTVTVTDVEEVGVVTVTPPRGWVEPPTRFEVHLTDDDEGRTNVNWQWARSSNGRSGWTDIEGATFNGYTADAEDANQYLRATVSYEDFDGSNKTASAVRSSPVGDTKPAMNNKPTFTETDPADRSVSAGTSAGRSVGAPVEANDDDPDDILTYSLDGRDADDFDIDAATGQVQTKAILDPLVKDTYEVFVGVHDGFDDGYEPSEDADADIAVIITVTTLPVTRPIITTGGGGGGGGGPANRPPVFEDADGNTVAEISREISEDAALGAKVGEPVVAADPDGDTLAYTLGGDDAASFTIGATTGQLTTQTALDHQTKPDYAVTVVATDPSGATAEIRVAITVTAVSFDCSAGNAVADAADHPGLVADCEALLASRNRLTGDAMLDWSEDTPITEWDGVSLGGTPQRVIRLHLQQKGLDGSIPADLGDLSRLEGLYLDRNELSGPIPPQLGQLSSLVHLTLHRNRFSGEIPADLGDLTALTFLSLYGNELTGELPAEFGSLSNLRWLYLPQQQVRGRRRLERANPGLFRRLAKPGTAAALRQQFQRRNTG